MPQQERGDSNKLQPPLPICPRSDRAPSPAPRQVHNSVRKSVVTLMTVDLRSVKCVYDTVSPCPRRLCDCTVSVSGVHAQLLVRVVKSLTFDLLYTFM